jgi:PhoPQ-activated pathogenicity-related protein
MSNWTHTLTVIVPESLIVQANQLALAIGTSEDDVNTFQTADWTEWRP